MARRQRPRAVFHDETHPMEPTIKPGDSRFPDYSQASIPRPRYVGGHDVTFGDTNGPRAHADRARNLAQEPTRTIVEQPQHGLSKYEEIRAVDEKNDKERRILIEKLRVEAAHKVSAAYDKELFEKMAATKLRQTQARAQWAAELLISDIKFNELV